GPGSSSCTDSSSSSSPCSRCGGRSSSVSQTGFQYRSIASTASGGSHLTQSGSPSRSVSLTDRAHHVLDARVVLEPVHREVLAVAGVLEAAVRHLGHERDVAVDPHAAEVEPLRHSHCAP